ncbi:MAG: Gfo/Idh/MocA family protein, partial [Thermoguttaceae bacterium]
MKRRDFLANGIVLGSGLGMSALTFPGTILAQTETESKVSETTPETEAGTKVRVGVIGCGRQGRALINAGLGIPELQFTAVCDVLPSAKRSAKLYLEFEDEEREIAAYSDAEEMLSEEKGKLDAVIVATPDFVHAPQTIAALKNGLHVYCEPMLANTPEAAHEMVDTAKTENRLIQVGYEHRSDPRYILTAKTLLSPEMQESLLGRITHLETQANRRVHAELIWAERDTLSQDILDKYGYASMREYRNWKQFKRYGCGPCATYLAQQF